MPALPQPIQDGPTVSAIYAAYAKRSEGPRRYLGASVIGKACDRALWFEFRWCGREQFEGRMLRLFESGHLEEIRLIHNLRAIGVTVHDVDQDGRQFGVSAIGGHFRGHMDAAVQGIPEAPKAWHVGEFKTHNEKSFAALRRDGVRRHKPEHVAQMMVYMHLTGMRRALYVAVNKNTDEIYVERLDYNEVDATRLMMRAERIIKAAEPPEGVATDRDAFACKWCNHKSRCHGPLAGEPAAPVNVTCRSCCHATPIVDDGDAGRWSCERHGRELTESDQAKGCPDHLLIPQLVKIGVPTDASEAKPGPAWIRYRTPDGRYFKNGQGGGAYSSAELASIPADAVGAPLVEALRGQLDAAVVVEPVEANAHPPIGAVVTTTGEGGEQ